MCSNFFASFMRIASYLNFSLPSSSYKDAIAVVTTGKQKFYSNGLDLEELESMTDSEKVNSFNEFQKLLARLLTFPMLTVAAINGMESSTNSPIPRLLSSTPLFSIQC